MTAPHVPALKQPWHSFLVGCISTFFSSINAFLPSPHLLDCYCFAFFLVQPLPQRVWAAVQPGRRNYHGGIWFVTGNSDLCHLVLSHRDLKTTCPSAATCILLSAVLWSLEQLKAWYVSSSARSREYPAIAKRHSDNTHKVLSFLQEISAVKWSMSLVQAE